MIAHVCTTLGPNAECWEKKKKKENQEGEDNGRKDLGNVCSPFVKSTLEL